MKMKSKTLKTESGKLKDENKQLNGRITFIEKELKNNFKEFTKEF